MNIDYTKGDWRKTFWSPYSQYKEHIGKPFTLVGVLPDAEETAEGTTNDMYRIRFADGAEIDAYPEEVFNGTVDGKPNRT